MNLRLILLIVLLLVRHTAFAADAPCKEGGTHPGDAGVANVGWSNLRSSDRGCSVKISTDGAVHYSRAYSFSEGGIIEVNNTYGPGKSSATTGSRTFMIFPRHQSPTAEVLSKGGNVKVVTSSGDVLYFLTENKLEIGDDETRTLHIEQKTSVNPNNQGGAELFLTGTAKRIIMDGGFSIGASAFTSPTRTSTFKDTKGHACSVPNSSLFTVNKDKEFKFKFEQDHELYKFLKSVPACRELEAPDLALSSGRVLKKTGPIIVHETHDFDEPVAPRAARATAH